MNQFEKNYYNELIHDINREVHKIDDKIRRYNFKKTNFKRISKERELPA